MRERDEKVHINNPRETRVRKATQRDRKGEEGTEEEMARIGEEEHKEEEEGEMKENITECEFERQREKGVRERGGRGKGERGRDQRKGSEKERCVERGRGCRLDGERD